VSAIGEPTFDPFEWITLGEAAEILRRKSDSSGENSRWRLVRLLGQRPATARLVTAVPPALANGRQRAGLSPLPDRCLWRSIDEIDWFASEVRAFPLLSGTDREGVYAQDHMLAIRVSRTDVVAVAQQEDDAVERRCKRGLAAELGTSDLAPITPKSAPDATDVRKPSEWRLNWIERFTARQRQVRKWINFAEIAEWCSKEDGSIVPSEQKRRTAFDTLQSDFLIGEFEENGRSRVLFLHPAIAKTRITRESLRDAIDRNDDGHHGRSQYLPYCWILHPMFDRFLAKHRLQESSRFRPQKTRRVSPAMSRDETAAIKALASDLTVNPELTRAEAENRCARFKVSQRGFQNRVWPTARTRAGLPAKASPGRKPKSLR
jgi:hypothetical protein